MTFWQIIKKNPSTLFLAIIVHLLAFAAIGLSFKSSEPNMSSVKEVKVIEAIVINENEIKAEINKLKKVEQRKKRDQKRLQDKARKAKKDRQNEERKLRALKKAQQKQERINKKKRLIEKKRLAEFEKKRKEQQQKQKEISKKLTALEKQRKEKYAQLEKEEKQRQDKVAKKKHAVAEKKRLANEQTQINKYEKLIKNQITSRWIIPVSYQKGMKCKVLVRLIPSGDVVGVRVIESSGNVAFDNSVKMAVNSASPLPVPKIESGLFKHFREVEFVFDPNG